MFTRAHPLRYKRSQGAKKDGRGSRASGGMVSMAAQGGFNPDRRDRAVTPTAARRWDTGTDIIRTSSSNS